jgi:uncharacterized protein
VSVTEIVVALVIAVGIIGVVVPILPGSILVGGAIVVWAFQVGGATAGSVAAVTVVLLLAGAVVKYAVPGRRLKASGLPNRTLLIGALVGIVGFFVVPVVGLVLGFVLGVYGAERARVGAELAWPSTKAALRAVGLGILIELAAAVLAAAVWVAGVALT